MIVTMVLVSSIQVPLESAGGLSLSSTCLVASPGTKVSIQVQYSPSGVGTGANATLQVVGSVPRGSNFTITPQFGSSPLAGNATISIANNTNTLGSYQLGIVGRAGGDYRIALFTLHVVAPGLSHSFLCNKIGLP